MSLWFPLLRSRRCKPNPFPMKRIIKHLLATASLVGLSLSGQAQLMYQMDVYDMTWAPMSGVQSFVVNVVPSDSTLPIIPFSLSTDVNGHFSDTLAGVPASGLVVSYITDCTGFIYSMITPYALSPAGAMVVDTFQIACANAGAAGATMHVSGEVLTQALPVAPVDSSLILIYVLENAGGVSLTPVYTNASGHYDTTVALLGSSGIVLVEAFDCQGNFYSNAYPYATGSFVPAAVDTFFVVCGGGGVVVLPPPTSSCNAEFIVDTVNSFNGQVVIWNTSAIPTWATTFSYQWDFGDGTFSTSPFPTHQYTAAGTYTLCVTVNASGSGITCSSTYCDTIGIDANGNLIYKGQTTGFQLVVLDPNSIGLEESQLEEVVAYPNPARDYIKLEVPSNQTFGYQVLDLSGRALVKGEVSSETSIDVSSFTNGMYFLQLSYGQATRTLKIQVAN